MAGGLTASVATILGYFSVRAYGAKGDNATDDTAAIQAAVNACAAAGGGVVYFPAGRYYVHGSIALPVLTGASGQPQIGLTLKGAWTPPTCLWGSSALASPPSSGASFIRTDLLSGNLFNVASPPTGAIIYEATAYSAIHVFVEDLNFESYYSPGIVVLNLGQAACATIRRVSVVGYSYYDTRQPLNPAATGLIMPVNGNAAICRVEDYTCIGYYTGLQMTEHLTASGQLFFVACHDAMVFPAQDHAVALQMVCVQDCLNAFTFTTKSAYNSTRFICQAYSYERHTDDWTAGGYEINDPNNYAKGVLWYADNNGTTFAKNGGTGVTCNNLGA